jgi:hypothetical protein
VCKILLFARNNACMIETLKRAWRKNDSPGLKLFQTKS